MYLQGSAEDAGGLTFAVCEGMSAAMKAEDRAAEEAEETQSKSVAGRGKSQYKQSPVGRQGLISRNNGGEGRREAGLRPPRPHKPS